MLVLSRMARRLKNAIACSNLDEKKIEPEQTSFFSQQIYLVKMTSLFSNT